VPDLMSAPEARLDAVRERTGDGVGQGTIARCHQDHKKQKAKQ
jgi:hypothetical protein